ncbi:MAG: hypothetical protein ACK5P5_02650 [Pseudobdellovibrionaceae bacterium]
MKKITIKSVLLLFVVFVSSVFSTVFSSAVSAQTSSKSTEKSYSTTAGVKAVSGTVGTSRVVEDGLDETFFQNLNYVFFVFGAGSDYHRNQEQISKNLPTESFLIGLHKDRYGLYYEANRFEEKSGTGNLTIERRNNSHMIWGDYDVFGYATSKKTFQFKGFLGLGLGMTLDTITTKFLSNEQKDQSEYQWKSGAQAGLEMQASVIALRAEGQILTGANRNPNPGYAGFVRIGLIF